MSAHPDRIVLTGLRAVGYHGVFEHERRDGQEFVVDVVLHVDTHVAAETDDLVHTINYADVAEKVHALITGDPAVAAHVQERLREQAGAALAAARDRSATVLADAADLLVRLPPTAVVRLPTPAMLATAQQDHLTGDGLAISDPAAATARYERAAAIAGQIERLVWERGIVATGSLVAGPLSTSDASLVEHWRFVEALATTTPGEELLPGGGMERIEDLAGTGWRHFAMKQAVMRTSVEVSRSQPAAGRGCLVIRAEAVDPAVAPVVVEV